MHVPRILRNEVVGSAELVEQQSGDAARQDDTEHDAPVSRTGDEQQGSTQEDCPHAGLTYRARDKTVDHVPWCYIRRRACSKLRERSSSGIGIYQLTAVPAPSAASAHERLVARHVSRVGEEQERTGDQGYVEDVVARTAEHLFGEDNGESSSYGNHPQRSVDRHDQRNQETGNEEALGDLFMFPLSHGELDAQTNDVTNKNIRQHSQQTEAESLPEQSRSQSAHELSGSQQVLIADIVHAEKHTRNECEHYVDHRALGVIARMDLRAKALAGGVRREEETLETVEQGPECVQLAAFLKVRAELLFQFI